MVQDIAAIVAELGLGSVSILGHAMGAINGYLLAARHPSMVERLVIVDAGPESLACSERALTDALDACRQAVFADPSDAVAERIAANPRAREPEMRRYVTQNLLLGADSLWRWRFDAARLASFMTLSPDPSAQWDALRQVVCPTVVIRGAESEQLSASTASRMSREIALAELLEIPGAGHDVHIDQPRLLLTTIREHLTQA
jgi:pimeloyl-ACP methyl ester carboxylesterase